MIKESLSSPDTANSGILISLFLLFGQASSTGLDSFNSQLFFHPKIFLGMKEASLLHHKVKWFSSWFGAFPLTNQHLSCVAAHEELWGRWDARGQLGCVGRRPYNPRIFWEAQAWQESLTPFLGHKWKGVLCFATLEMHFFWIILSFFIQQVLISHPFYTHQCIHVNPNLPIHGSALFNFKPFECSLICNPSSPGCGNSTVTPNISTFESWAQEFGITLTQPKALHFYLFRT